MKKVICSSNAPSAIGPYSQAIAANGMVYNSFKLFFHSLTPAGGSSKITAGASPKQPERHRICHPFK